MFLQLPDSLGLNALDEGHIGKIRVHKSGKITLCVNNGTLLNVSLSVSGAFLQVSLFNKPN